MALLGTVQSASLGFFGFDTVSTISGQIAMQFVRQGFRFCIRYVARGPQPPNDLSQAEANLILDAGLALMPVQHGNPSQWLPTAQLGNSDGAFAARNSTMIGFPADITVWCDLEGINTSVTPKDVIGYCNAWYAAVKGAGYKPGLYVGPNSILNGQQLYSLSFQAYWRSQSDVPNVANRGYQLIQLYPPVERNGIKIDINVTQSDYKDGQIQWLSRVPGV